MAEDAKARAKGGLTDPHLKRTFKGHRGPITAVSMNPAGRQLATASEDSCVHVYDFNPQKRPFRFVGHKGPVYDVGYSPTGEYLVSAS